jgi:hypothetical protein
MPQRAVLECGGLSRDGAGFQIYVDGVGWGFGGGVGSGGFFFFFFAWV